MDKKENSIQGLTEFQHQLLKEFEIRVLEIMELDDLPESDWEEFPALWSGYGPDQGGCFRDGGIFDNHEDVNRGIYNKFYCLLRFVTEKIEEHCQVTNMLSVFIDPDYYDNTRGMILNLNAMKVVFFESDKAWLWEWSTPVDLANSIEEFISRGIQEYKR
ncbi:MAG: hypothetical protein V1767_00700 [Chloroflexota bacterium]